MKHTNLIYGFLFMFFAISCNERVIDSESLTQDPATASNLKSAAIGTTYYVSPYGSNSNPGTEARPFQTIAYAASLASPGNTIILEDGTYTTTSPTFGALNRSGNSSAYITYKARNKGGAILDGRSNTTQFGFSVSGSYINIEGLEIKNISDVGLIVGSGASYINLRDLNIHDIGRKCTDSNTGFGATYFTNSSNITVERCLIHDIGRFGPGENGCWPSTTNYKTHDHGIYCDGVSNITIQNNYFYNISHGFALQVYSGSSVTSSNITFTNNTCQNGNIYHPASFVVLWGNVSTASITRNIFKDHLNYAIQVYPTGYSYYNVTIAENISSGGNKAIVGTAYGVTIYSNYDSSDPYFTNTFLTDYSLLSDPFATSTAYSTVLPTTNLNTTTSGTTASNLSSTIYYSVQTIGNATKNDCGPGYKGSSVPYNILAGAYTSTISQADANSKAISDMNNNIQAWANLYGTCTPVSGTSVYYSVQTIGWATKNNCGPGYVGSPVRYNILAGAYTSTISQEDANSKAISDMNNNIQAWANSHGSCTAQ